MSILRQIKHTVNELLGMEVPTDQVYHIPSDVVTMPNSETACILLYTIYRVMHVSRQRRRQHKSLLVCSPSWRRDWTQSGPWSCATLSVQPLA